MNGTARFNLPFLVAGQAQKEFIHNEALQTLDLVIAAAVEEGPRADPPATPPVGACYIVAALPTGAWTGHALALAGYTSGGWRFVAPLEGMVVHVKSEGLNATFSAGAWETGPIRASGVLIGGEQVVGPRLAGISSASGGTTVDVEARSVIDQLLAALRTHGLIGS